MRRRVAGAMGGVVLIGLMMFGCGGRRPDDLGVTEGRLRECPSSPNCVSSFAPAQDELHAIAALRVDPDAAGGLDAAWKALLEELARRPRVEIVTREPDYLHAVFTTRLMRYRDDVEFLRRDSASEIAVRSASRLGYGDMGANRARVESLRSALAARGVVRGVEAD